MVLFMFVLSCQSSPQVEFENISIGASRGEVLAAMGSPFRSYYKNGTDIWVYKMQSKSGHWMTKELLIKNGIVIQKKIPPENKPLESDYEELK